MYEICTFLHSNRGLTIFHWLKFQYGWAERTGALGRQPIGYYTQR